MTRLVIPAIISAMRRLQGPSLLQQLRGNRPLRLLFALTGLLWMLSANACALHDMTTECQYTSTIADVHPIAMPDVTSDADSAAQSHVPCCPHPLGSQLPVQETHVHFVRNVAERSGAPVAFSQSFLSHSQTPPTPPPKRA
jgi:hypothetical protein